MNKENKNNSIYGLPEEIKFCKSCIMSNQRPSSVIEFKNKGESKKGINIDKDLICDACKYHQIKKSINWQEREKQLFKFLKQFKKNNGEYDCIVPSSGGKDSSFAAHTLKYKYGMNPLAVTWAPSMWTDIGLQNFNNLSRVGGIDSYLCTPNGNLHSFLTKEAFLNLGHPFNPFIHGQKVVGPKIASQLNIKLVVYGENQAEYGNDIKENHSFNMNSDFFSIEDNTNIEDINIAGSPIKELIKKSKFKIDDFASYIPLKKSLLKKKDISMIYLGFYEKWDPQECFYYAVENTGFRPAKERSEGTYSKYTEIDDKMVPFHFYTMFIKFGIGRATYDACQEIRNEKINRKEAIKLVSKFDHEFPKKYFKEFLDYIKISENEFFKKIDEMRSPHLWEYKNSNWILKKNCFNT
jgi:N-acetyl sugar amidotransferase|tara:strand:+ start:1755 stop:2981 length:1227 start_codon:yes stop_codon:yes gene_type:complete